MAFAEIVRYHSSTELSLLLLQARQKTPNFWHSNSHCDLLMLCYLLDSVWCIQCTILMAFYEWRMVHMIFEWVCVFVSFHAVCCFDSNFQFSCFSRWCRNTSYMSWEIHMIFGGTFSVTFLLKIIKIGWCMLRLCQIKCRLFLAYSVGYQ